MMMRLLQLLELGQCLSSDTLVCQSVVSINPTQPAMGLHLAASHVFVLSIFRPIYGPLAHSALTTPSDLKPSWNQSCDVQSR